MNPEPVFIEGRGVCLRRLVPADINARYVGWLNDRDVTRYMEAGTFPSGKEDLLKFYKETSASRTDVIFAIARRRNGQHIGNIKLGGINWIHRFADLGIMIGDKTCWNKGYGSEACGLALDYAFGRLNLNKVVLGVCGAHRSAVKAYRRAGFKIEGRLKRMLNLDGRYEDKVMMSILKDDWTAKARKIRERRR
jgi:RimJ/RimL family protein N-acetyltransferase